MSIIWSENNANVSSHKCDPSRDDYNRMASALLDAYPHVKGLLDTAEPWYVNSFKAGNVVCILLALYCGHVMYKVNYFVSHYIFRTPPNKIYNIAGCSLASVVLTILHKVIFQFALSIVVHMSVKWHRKSRKDFKEGAFAMPLVWHLPGGDSMDIGANCLLRLLMCPQKVLKQDPEGR